MAENNDQPVFFVDDELIERLMRGDKVKVEDSNQQKRPANVSTLAKAIGLATEGRLDEAIKELERAAENGENPVEVCTALGHLRFEQQNWSEAGECYAKVAALEPKHRTAHY